MILMIRSTMAFSRSNPVTSAADSKLTAPQYFKAIPLRQQRIQKNLYLYIKKTDHTDISICKYKFSFCNFLDYPDSTIYNL